MQRQLKAMALLIAALIVSLVMVWWAKTLTTKTPDDKVWNDLNSRMPGLLQGWACAHVQNRLAAAGPAPVSCESAWN
jgi:hypothetical protein